MFDQNPNLKNDDVKKKHQENLALQVPDSKKCSLEPSKYSWLEQPEVWEST